MTIFRKKQASSTDPTQRARPAPRLALMATGGPPRPEVKPDRVRARAFEIYQARGGASGDALSDWLQAEHELNGAPDGVPVPSPGGHLAHRAPHRNTNP